MFSSAEAIREGRLPLALPPQKRLQQVALADLGALVLAILGRRGEHVGTRVEVAGDDPKPQEMADAIGVRLEWAPLEQLAQRSPDLAAMYSFLAKDGYAVDIQALRQRYPEVRWKGFAEWAAQIDWRGVTAAGE